MEQQNYNKFIILIINQHNLDTCDARYEDTKTGIVSRYPHQQLRCLT